MQAFGNRYAGRIQGLDTHFAGDKTFRLGMHPHSRFASADFGQRLTRHRRAFDPPRGSCHHLHRLTHGHTRIARGNVKQQRQRLFAQLSAAADKLQIQHDSVIGQGAGTNDRRCQARIVGQRFNGKACGIDDFEQDFLRLDHLASDHAAGADHPGDRRD